MTDLDAVFIVTHRPLIQPVEVKLYGKNPRVTCHVAGLCAVLSWMTSHSDTANFTYLACFLVFDKNANGLREEQDDARRCRK